MFATESKSQEIEARPKIIWRAIQREPECPQPDPVIEQTKEFQQKRGQDAP